MVHRSEGLSPDASIGVAPNMRALDRPRKTAGDAAVMFAHPGAVSGALAAIRSDETFSRSSRFGNFSICRSLCAGARSRRGRSLARSLGASFAISAFSRFGAICATRRSRRRRRFAPRSLLHTRSAFLAIYGLAGNGACRAIVARSRNGALLAIQFGSPFGERCAKLRVKVGLLAA